MYHEDLDSMILNEKQKHIFDVAYSQARKLMKNLSTLMKVEVKLVHLWKHFSWDNRSDETKKEFSTNGSAVELSDLLVYMTTTKYY